MAAMTQFLHTMVRVTDPAKSKAFYEALGFEAGRELPHRAHTASSRRPTTSSALDGQPDVLELTYNHDGRTYDLGTGYGHIAVGVADLDGTLARAQGARASSPSERPTRSAKAARSSASCATRTATGSS